MADQAFQVDLRGVVDLLSRHLYASPRVYLRELLQNAVDAITARGAGGGRVVIETGGGALRVHDDGVGLTADEVHTLLATIGRSSKRDELGFARHDFLGQFGIGLLSGFLVADEIEVVSRSAKGGDAVRWTGRSEGSYQVEPGERDEPGTTVTLRPRPGSAELLSAPVVAELARTYGSLLPIELVVDGVTVTGEGPPWRASHRDPGVRRRALERYCEELYGFTPFDVVDLEVAEAGLTGVAFVLPEPVSPSARGAHRVYLKRMLLAESVQELLPEWAFFVRCVVDAGELRPTASREALFEDELLESARQGLGEVLRQWLVRLAETDPPRLRAFLRLHQLGVKAMALHDDDMLRIVDRWMEFETSAGLMTLHEFRRRHPDGRFTGSVEEFRRLSAVAGAQGVGLVNGGYVHDTEIIERLPDLDPDIRLTRLDASELATTFGLLDPAAELALRPFLAAAQRALERLGCEVVVRDFDPASLPALYLTSRDAQFREELSRAREEAGELWADVLGAVGASAGAERPQLVLNYRNPLTRRVTALGADGPVEPAVQALYGQALLLGHHPLRPADTAVLNRSFIGLLEWAVHPPEAGQ
ncbi:HSP90 family protein [Actinomadura verrucosospora]|uniref:ATP-binding region ATPase domain-containing protein n=1 Tax=Actinomadura verrucosospora TaxID=46165 RepID=A0A7D4ARP1_ACTVE|nr:HSP90 family protein [Actinomadura verrucosospora]QKG24988.1 ATP-binding region ATPase domain-containing protein [Actinomadura verrucosospora]